jgi:hypothetical protein
LKVGNNMAAIISDMPNINDLIDCVKMLSRGLLGGRFIMSGSGGSTVSARAGSPSVVKFTLWETSEKVEKLKSLFLKGGCW